MSEETAPIGFVGLGQMGLPMAKHILASGRQVVAWSRDAEEREAFRSAGGTIVETLAGVGQSPIILSIVFDDEAVRDVVLRPGGLAENMTDGALLISMETISPALAREVSETLSAKGVAHLSSPVFGPPHVAAAAELKFNCSGPSSAYRQAEPVLATMGTSCWFGAEPEQALLVKLMGNNMIFAMIGLMHEAFGFLAAGGVREEDAKQMLVDRLFQSPIITGYAEFFANNPGAKPPFKANPIPKKDNTLCLQTANTLGVKLPIVNIIQKQIDKL